MSAITITVAMERARLVLRSSFQRAVEILLAVGWSMNAAARYVLALKRAARGAA